MALTFTNRGSSFVTTNATSYATGSFTPSANALMVCILYASSTDTSASDPSSVSGNGVTYQKIGASHFISGVATGSLWVGATSGSPSAGAVTASGWATARTGVGMQVWEVTGATITTNGADGIGTGSPVTGSGTATRDRKSVV